LSFVRIDRYAFQGQESDPEIKGEGNSVNYKYRMHDPRIGRFFARDPLAAKYPYYSPYAFSGNRVIDAVELEGLEPANYMNRETGDMVYNLDLGTSSFSVDWGDGLIYHWDFVSYYDPVLENPNSEVIILNLEKVEQNTCSPEIQTGESLVEDNKGEIQAESMLGTIVDDWTGALLDGSKERWNERIICG
jgi:RHS repeat-associated protein